MGPKGMVKPDDAELADATVDALWEFLAAGSAELDAAACIARLQEMSLDENRDGAVGEGPDSLVWKEFAKGLGAAPCDVLHLVLLGRIGLHRGESATDGRCGVVCTGERPAEPGPAVGAIVADFELAAARVDAASRRATAARPDALALGLGSRRAAAGPGWCVRRRRRRQRTHSRRAGLHLAAGAE